MSGKLGTDAPTHVYRTTLAWSGSTGAGYETYDRTHTVTAGELAPMPMSADHAFRGDPALVNPEQLLLAAASSCQFLSFLAVAARARIDVVEYVDDAEAVMPPEPRPTRITEIVLRPRITVRTPAGTGSDGTGTPDTERLRARIERLLDVAHHECFIANSLKSEIRIEAQVKRC